MPRVKFKNPVKARETLDEQLEGQLKSSYPIPVHVECKSSTGGIRPSQVKQRARIQKSGSIYLLIDNPEDFHEFFVKMGYDRLEMQGQLDLDRKTKYKEAEVVSFVKGYLKLAEKIYNVYWDRNHQSLGSTHGRPDFYVELPPLEEKA